MIDCAIGTPENPYWLDGALICGVQFPRKVDVAFASFFGCFVLTKPPPVIIGVLASASRAEAGPLTDAPRCVSFAWCPSCQTSLRTPSARPRCKWQNPSLFRCTSEQLGHLQVSAVVLFRRFGIVGGVSCLKSLGRSFRGVHSSRCSAQNMVSGAG